MLTGVCKLTVDTNAIMLVPDMRKCASNGSAIFLVLPSGYRQDPFKDFHDQYVKWRGFGQGFAFWGPKNKILHFDLIIPQNPNFSPVLDGTISRQKGLNNGDAHLSTTIDRHRSPMKVV